MLFTRCPDCDTTFRVTDDALKKANGQVRCGRCASVFNAYAERRDEPGEPLVEPTSQPAPAADGAAHNAKTAPPLSGAPPVSHAVPAAQTLPLPSAPLSVVAAASVTAAPPPVSVATVPVGALAPLQTPPAGAVAAPETPPAAPVTTSTSNPPRPLAAPAAREGPHEPPLESDTDPLAGLSVASVVAELEQDAVDDDEESSRLFELAAAQDAAMPPTQVEAVLETEPIGDWRNVPKESVRRSGRWNVGVAAAFAALSLQLVNHYRAELVKQPSIGTLVQSVYAALGVVVLPRWDVRQYQILDWVATAEPSSGGIGSLRITARIKNVGSDYQPYPDVNLRLKDRWEAAVGGRVFAPAEYLAAAPRKLMAPGETARAQLELVDPGPDAYGFDLDVCVEVETHVLSCRNDKVFL